MTLSSRAQAFSVANLLRSCPHATHEVQPTAPPDGHLVKAREDDGVSSEGSICEEEVRKERNEVARGDSHEREGLEESDDVSGSHVTDPKVAESLSSCFCHGDLTFCIHPAMLSVKDENVQSGKSITAELLHADLWSSFHRLGTEMIITKSGRRMFPALKMRITGLNAEKNYTTRLEFVQPDFSKYRYIYPSSRWMISGTGDVMTSSPSHMTPECPSSGHMINSQVLSFERLKLTNSEQKKAGQVSLVSMQKFQPKVVIQEDVGFSTCQAERYVIVFPQTSFMAVTAYQNQQITTLKIASNPFAKGFRESGKMRYPEALTSQPPYFSTEQHPMQGLTSMLQPHPTPSYLAVRDARMASKRPLSSSLSSLDDEKPAAKLSRLAESKRISEHTTPPTVLYPTPIVSNGHLPLHLSPSHLQHLQQLADPSAYLRSPFLNYGSSMPDAYHLSGRCPTPTMYADVSLANQSRSPTPGVVSVANRQHHDPAMFSDDRLPIHTRTIRNRLSTPDSAPAVRQICTFSPMPPSRPFSDSAKDRLSSDVLAKSEKHSGMLRHHIKEETEVIGQMDHRRHISCQYYCPASPPSKNTPDEIKRPAIPESIANGYECAPLGSLLGQRLSGRCNVLSESLRSYSQFHWRPFPLSDAPKCLIPHGYNDTMARNVSQQLEQHQTSNLFQGHHRLMERHDRHSPMIDARTLFRCVDEENVKPTGSVVMHDASSRNVYPSMQSSKDVNDRLLLIH